MNLNFTGPGLRKYALLTAALILTFAATGVEVGGQASARKRTVLRSPRTTVSARQDRSRPLRDVRPIPPRRDRVELEMRKPRPLRQMRPQPAGGGKKLADPVVQSAPAAANMPSFSQNFEGVGNVNGVLPPDTNGAVGPNHYVQWVNLSFAIYDKSGTLLYGPADGSTLWSGMGGVCELSNDGDPVVLHDDLSDRWVMSQLAIPYFPFGPFYQCIAISQTSDPTGAYHRYEFVISEDKLNDYPKFGVWPDAYYMAVNQFDVFTQGFVGQGVVAFERDKMLAGLPARMIYFDLFDVDPNLGGMLPAHAEGAAPPPGSPNPYVLFDDDAWGFASQDQLQLWNFHVDWNDPAASTFTGPSILATAPFDSNLCDYARNCIPQPGTNRKVDSIPDRLMYRLQYRNFGTHESLVVNHTVDVGGDHAGLRWYEIRDPLAAPFIHQQGTYAPDADHRWMGSVAMDGAGNMALGFSISSNATFPSVRYAGRLAGDPFGTMAQGETELIAGGGSQTDSSGRWGDYSAMTVDPSDQCTFWYTQEYYATTSSSNWRTRIGAFAFPSCGTNLPVVTATATSPNASEAGPANGVFTVSRTGSTSASLTVSYAVSGTATPGVDYVPLSGSVTIPVGATTATIDVTPIDDPQVEDDESVSVTLGVSPQYAVGTPSNAIVYVASDDFPPDLVVSALSAPANAGAGASISVTDTTANPGAGAAEASVTRFYLSTNTILNAGDVALGERAIPALVSGANSAASTTVTIPAATAGGSYYIIARADADDLLTESVETNNVRATFIQIGADLVVSPFFVPTSAGQGTSVTVIDTTKNQGGAAAGPSTTRFYLSVNAGLDASDVPLGGRAVPALAPGATNSGSTTLTIPANTASGNYYILAQADGDGVVAETQETNNLNYGFIQIGPDLTVSALTAPATGSAGGAITVSDTTKNQGGGAAGASTTRYYFSANTTFDAGDALLGSRAVPTLAAGVTNSGSATVTIPTGTTSGGYYILALADADNAVAESQETNNIRAASIQVGADLVVSALTVPPSAGQGASIAVSDTTKNQGGGAAGASTTRFYLSVNAGLDASDVPLGGRAVPALAPGATNAGSTSLTIPAGTASGNYYVLAQADGDGGVVETQENNNLNYGFIQIGPDLTVAALTVPATGRPGGAITVTDSTKNQGGGAAGASTTRFYLSTNTTLDGGDVTLGSRAVPALAAGVINTGSASVTISAGTAAGSYYVLAVADADNVVPESQEGNNARASFVQIGSDLVISALSVPPAVGQGAAITVTDTTKNQGGASAGASTTRFFLSANAGLDAGDVSLGSHAVPALAPNATSFGSTSLTIPVGTASGGYFILAQADGDGVVGETQENNNLNYASIQIGPDLTVTALSAPATGSPGAVVTVTDSTKNQGGGAAGASTTRLYFSTNATLDAGDTLLGGRAVPALAAGVTNSGSSSVTIPAGTSSGGYYILAVADADNVMVESQEGNNVRASFIQIGADLVVSALSVPPTGGQGLTITVTDTTKNQGGGVADPSTTRFYLSVNAGLDVNDVLLGSRAVPALAAGATNPGSTSLTIPANTASGAYYLLAQADGDGVVVETQENNNLNYVFIQIGADLTVSALTAPVTASAGSTVALAESTKNQGGGGAAASTTRFYLSTNTFLDSGDVPVGERAIPTLGPGVTNAGSPMITIPAGTAAGNYYIIAKADADGLVSESQEGNNLRAVPIQITAGSASVFGARRIVGAMAAALIR